LGKQFLQTTAEKGLEKDVRGESGKENKKKRKKKGRAKNVPKKKVV